MKHAQKNWYGSDTGNHQGLIISEDTGENVAVCYDKENAGLIAVAPEMLRLLIECEKRLEFAKKRDPQQAGTYHDHNLKQLLCDLGVL